MKCPQVRGVGASFKSLNEGGEAMRSARRKKTHPSTRTAFESLESRAMLAGLGTDSLSGLGSTTAVLLPGTSSSSGIVLTGGSPTLGSASGTSGSQPNGPVLFCGTGSGSGSSTSGSGSSTPNGPVLLSQYTGGSNPGTQGTGTNNGGTFSGSDLWLLYSAGLGAANSSSGGQWWFVVEPLDTFVAVHRRVERRRPRQ